VSVELDSCPEPFTRSRPAMASECERVLNLGNADEGRLTARRTDADTDEAASKRRDDLIVWSGGGGYWMNECVPTDLARSTNSGCSLVFLVWSHC